MKTRAQRNKRPNSTGVGEEQKERKERKETKESEKKTDEKEIEKKAAKFVTDIKEEETTETTELIKRQMQTEKDRLAAIPSVEPFFIIKFGPPASGKSTVVAQIYRDVLQIDEKNVFDVDVDEWVNRATPFAARMRKLLALVEEKETAPELSRPIQEQTTLLYFHYRSQVDFLANALINEALLERKHVSIETLGLNRESLANYIRFIQRHHYKVVFVYPYVADAVLQRRVTTRNAKQLRKIAPSLVLDWSRKSQETFQHLAPLADQALLVENSEEGTSNFPKKIVLDLHTGTIACTLSRCKEALHEPSTMVESLQSFITDKCKSCKPAKPTHSTSSSS